MSEVIKYALPALLVVFVWWASTGAIFYLNRRAPHTHLWSVLGAAGVAAIAVFALAATRVDPGAREAAIAFAAAIAIWGLIEISFLMGYVTGPRRAPCPDGCSGLNRFRYACLAIAYHELAIVASLVLIGWQTIGSANFVGVATFAVLWLMRLSTKLNIFLGVPNTAAELLPPKITYLGSYFRKGPLTGFFAVSVTLATTATCLLGMRAAQAATSFEIAAYAMLASLSALGLVEHWFMVLPVPTEVLWGWSLGRPDGTRVPRGQRDRGDQAARHHLPLELQGIARSTPATPF